MNPWAERDLLKKQLAVALGIVDAQRQDIADLEAQLAAAREASAAHSARAAKLLAKVYDLQAERFDGVRDRHFDEMGRVPT